MVSSSLSDTDLQAAAQAATGKDIAFVFITADSGYDYRSSFYPLRFESLMRCPLVKDI